MTAAIKAEFRKLISVRSTYVIVAITLALITFTAFYLEGVWGQTGSAASTLQPSALKEVVGNSAGVAALLISIVAILQVGHEYRHNMITYTLTSNTRRTQVFLAKAIVLGLFAILFGLFASAFAAGAYYVGLEIRNAALPPQDFNLVAQAFRLGVYAFVYGMAGFLLTILIRNLIGAIVLIMIFPTTIEPLLGLLLKDNAVYLPFSAFDHILGVAIRPGDMSQNTAVIVGLAYIGALGVISWLSFVRRDAS